MGKNRGGGGIVNGTQERIQQAQTDNDKIVQSYDDSEKAFETKEYQKEIESITDYNLNIVNTGDKEEKKALEGYTGTKYMEINKELRSKGYNALTMDKDIRSQVDKIDKVLDKLKTKEQVYFRKVSVKGENLKTFLNEHKVGNTVKYRSYTSTSRERGHFGWNINYNNAALLHIMGTPALIEKSSLLSEEKEGLFKRDSNFKIEAVKYIDNQPHIYMRQVS